MEVPLLTPDIPQKRRFLNLYKDNSIVDKINKNVVLSKKYFLLYGTESGFGNIET